MKNKTYFRLLAVLGLIFFLAQYSNSIFTFLEHASDGELVMAFFLTSVLFALSFASFYLPAGSVFPSFVAAIFLGIAAKPLLGPVVENEVVLNTLVSVGAALILFGGGVEMPFANFKKLFWKITSLSFPGLFLTAFLFSGVMVMLGKVLGVNFSIVVAVLLGAVLASTDPASIIPVLKQLRFKNRDTQDVIIAESAMTDVTGTLLTVVFLSIVATGGTLDSLTSGYQNLFTVATGIFLLKQVGYGVLLGVGGFLLLGLLTKFKKRHEQEFEVDAVYFMFAPLLAFAIAMALGGSGYLAAFAVGLLFVINEHLEKSVHYFNHTIEGLLKPIIFLLLGAMVDIQSLIDYAVIGIMAAMIFMFVIRPIAVFIALGPFTYFGKDKNKFSWRELLFISFVRETGAIPAVLLITVAGSGISNLEGLLSVGMWVILSTLILQPPLTPLMARGLQIAEDIKDNEEIKLQKNGQTVVLASRGNSYKRRLPIIMDWALKHNANKVILLHCLEDKYSVDLVEKTGKESKNVFADLNNKNKEQGKGELKFAYISREGFLHDNIKNIASHDNISLIFVGKKALDYHLSEFQSMSVPFYFMD